MTDAQARGEWVKCPRCEYWPAGAFCRLCSAFRLQSKACRGYVPPWVAVQYALLGGGRRSTAASAPEAHITDALDEWLKTLEQHDQNFPEPGKAHVRRQKRKENRK